MAAFHLLLGTCLSHRIGLSVLLLNSTLISRLYHTIPIFASAAVNHLLLSPADSG